MPSPSAAASASPSAQPILPGQVPGTTTIEPKSPSPEKDPASSEFLYSQPQVPGACEKIAHPFFKNDHKSDPVAAQKFIKEADKYFTEKSFEKAVQQLMLGIGSLRMPQ